MIRLQFSTTLAWQSAVIRRIIHSPFSHVDALDEHGNCIGASDSPDAPVVAGNPHGVAVRPPNYEVYGARYVAELDATPAAERAFYAAIHSQVGKPFDNEALHAFLGSDPMGTRDWRAEDKWFCSELVTWALERSQFWPYELLVSKNRVSPADLLLLLNPKMSNIATFWDPPPPPKLAEGE